jgi:PTS system nitrogen regulatory IIA component
MKILDVLEHEAILFELKASDKKGVLEELVAPISSKFNIDKNEFVRILLEREKLGSTGIGGGIGIPHGKMKELDRLILGFGLSKKGVNFESIDGRPTHIFFLLITPENSTVLHLKLLARISRLLKNEPFKQRLIGASDIHEIIAAIQEEDEEF